MDAKNFTQEDVNEGRLLYEHRRPFSNLTAFDVISLEALADYAQRSLDLVLNIRISGNFSCLFTFQYSLSAGCLYFNDYFQLFVYILDFSCFLYFNVEFQLFVYFSDMEQLFVYIVMMIFFSCLFTFQR